MFKFLKKDKSEAVEKPKSSWFSRLRSGLSKTRQKWGNAFTSIFLGKKQIDDELLELLETQLLSADVGFKTTQSILDQLVENLGRSELKDEQNLIDGMKHILLNMLQRVHKPLTIDTTDKPFLLMMIGTNGSGKTTTIGKLAHQFMNEKQSVMLAAGDTFRAAAIEQLQAWGERNDVPVIAQQQGSDSASVVFDALQSAQAKGTDILIADTAGRLHTQHNLMEELKKIVRVTQKLKAGGPDEILLVLDASFGQNALQQAKMYDEAIGIDGIVVTKLDGTAKGGIIFSIAEELRKPIRYIGVGESIEDLQVFNPEAFIESLLETTIDDGS